MQNQHFIIQNIHNHLFGNELDKQFAELIIDYVLFDQKITTTPAIWQDAEIYIRFRKRNVWTLSKEKLDFAKRAFMLYSAKYITNHLKKSEILTILNQFFNQSTQEPIQDTKSVKSTQSSQGSQNSQSSQGSQNSQSAQDLQNSPSPQPPKPLVELFNQKLHTEIASLFLTQEKIIVTKEMANNLDRVFEYPSWLEFTDEATETIFAKILDNQLTDVQIDYFLGASDDSNHYDQWFKVAKHVLMTTHNAHTFWTAGDIMAIIWQAVPDDAESQKWFKDQLFEIFWARVQSVWPLLNEDKIDFTKTDETKIMKDSINWLRVLDDLKERLPELGKDFELFNHDTSEADFAYLITQLENELESNHPSIDGLIDLFCKLSDYAYDETSVAKLQAIAKNKLIPIIKKTEDSDTSKDAIKLINHAIAHAKKYITDLANERQNLSKLLEQQ